MRKSLTHEEKGGQGPINKQVQRSQGIQIIERKNGSKAIEGDSWDL